MKIVSKAEAVSCIESGNRVFIQGAAMTPNALVDAMCDRYQELSDVEIISIHTEGNAKYAHEPYHQSFKMNSCFVGQNVRRVVNSTQGDYIPIFLSEIHLLFRQGILPIDVAIVQVSPPDKHGTVP